MKTVGVKHRYLGDWFKPGEKFKDAAHEKWGCDPVRNYCRKPAKKPAEAGKPCAPASSTAQ